VEYVTWIWKTISAYRILMGKFLGKLSLGTHCGYAQN